MDKGNTAPRIEIDQLDLFVAEMIDPPIKSDITTMEYPIFSLTTKTDTDIYRYENKATGSWIEVIPSAVGRATIFDKDLLIYCISQVREAMNRGKETSRRVKVVLYNYLITTGRDTGGVNYKNTLDSLARLRGTTFKTNILSEQGKRKVGRVFGLIDDASVIEERGRMVGVEIVLSESIYASINAKKVLTYNRSYYGLRSPNERRMYELCRKHCGNQPYWNINIDNLHAKFGSRSSLREFRRMIKGLVTKQSIPDYLIDYEPADKERGYNEKLIVTIDKNGEDKKLLLKEN